MKDNEIMEREIQSRIENDLWDMRISKKVINAISKENEKSIKVWKFASLATAAISLIISVAALQATIFNNALYAQADSWYSYEYNRDDGNLFNDAIATDIELTINEIYPMR
ncbi:MAG: hypothetical protein FWG92_01655 [Leptospirales bacterium]|nr:hypothetical protein [Leptospirales bacterium]